jgi:hypothetical protein
MPLKSLAQGSFFDPEFVCPSILESGTVPWLLGRFRSWLFPPWLFKGWRGESKVGRNAWPAFVLTCLWLLRWTEEGMSRLASVNRAKADLQWRAAMGLECDLSPPSERTMRDFERFLAERHSDVDVPRYILIHEHIVRMCTEHGVVGEWPLWGIDSTPMWCYGATLDTVRLLGDGLRQLGRSWARGTRCLLTEVAELWGLPLLLAKSTKGWFDIDWRDRDARAAVVDQLAGHVVRLVAWVRQRLSRVRPGLRKGILRKCRNLLRVVSNDLEADEQGRLVPARRVARDRLISMTDPQARHGRKSNKRLFNGFKLNVIGDLVSGLIAAVTVTAGNQHDSTPTHRLVRRAKALFDDIEQVLGDTAYGGTRVRHEISQQIGVNLLTPPPPDTRDKASGFAKSKFIIDFAAEVATCPGGFSTGQYKTVNHSDYNLPTYRYKWSKQTCCACPLNAECLGQGYRSKSLLLHPFEQELRNHREAWKKPEVRKEYRRRGEFERLINTAVRHGARQARSWGLTAANIQAHGIATTSNLRLLAKAMAAANDPSRGNLANSSDLTPASAR